jgi:hypothetical protein
MTLYLASRPLTSLARQTQTDTDGRRNLALQVKILYCPRVVCVCLRLIYLKYYRMQRGATALSFDSFGNDPP